MSRFHNITHEPIHRSAMPYSTPMRRGTEHGRSRDVQPSAAPAVNAQKSVQPLHTDVHASDATNKGKSERFDTNIPRAYLNEPKRSKAHAKKVPHAPAFDVSVHDLKKLAKTMGMHFSDSRVVEALCDTF